jgi:hypothetical protein
MGRLLAAVGIVSGCFALATPLGPRAFYGATIAALALGAMVLFAKCADVRRGALLAAGILGGAAVGGCCLGDFILHVKYGYDHGRGEGEKSMLAGALIGALIGGFLALRPWRLFDEPMDRIKRE